MSVYPSRKLYYILYGILLLLLAIIGIGSIVGLKRKLQVGTQPPAEQHAIQRYEPPKDRTLYGDIGQLRAATVDIPSVTVIVTPFLEYTASDIALQEELVNKKAMLKKTILKWFSVQSAYRLSSMLPEDIKQSVMQKINAQLTLGKIHNIYFEEFIVLY